MDDYVMRWRLDELLVLNEHAIEVPIPARDNTAWSLSFWFLARDLTGKQVIANQGCTAETDSGWAVFLEGDSLHALWRCDATAAFEISLPGLAPETWSHFAMAADYATGSVSAYLYVTGAKSHVHRSMILSSWPGNIPLTMRLGGFTDPAGGHFDHTFGRDGSGLLDDLRIYPRPLSTEALKALIDLQNVPPTAVLDVFKESDDAPTTVQFDASRSADADGKIEACLWDFGDGTKGSGISPAHRYAYAGSYPVRLTVIDDDHGYSAAEHHLVLTGQRNPLRVTPVFTNGQEGYACYRIPSIVCTTTGVLLAFAEGRLESCSDSTRTTHIVCKRSADNGLTWGPLQVIARNERVGALSATQNCSPVVDTLRDSGRIIVLYNKSEYSEWDLARGVGSSRCCRIISDDDGLTWQNELDITNAVYRPDAGWRIQRPTLGHAIQLRSEAVAGRIFHAGVFSAGERSVFESQNYAFWSDDLGETWTIGGIAPRIGLNEATAVELEDGRIMFNSRAYTNQKPTGRRAVTIGAFDRRDQLVFEPTQFDAALVDPAVQASIARYTWASDSAGDGRSRILFSNPNHARARRRMTVQMSYDEGQTWPICKVIDPGPSSYSDLVVQSDLDIGLLYERGNQGGIVYASFLLDWLSDGQDSIRGVDA